MADGYTPSRLAKYKHLQPLVEQGFGKRKPNLNVRGLELQLKPLVAVHPPSTNTASCSQLRGLLSEKNRNCIKKKPTDETDFYISIYQISHRCVCRNNRSGFS